MENLKRNYDSSKVDTLITMGMTLLREGYEPAFVAGFLGNIQHEGGTVGLFESTNYDKIPEKKKPYHQYMDDNYDYRHVYSYHNITEFNLSDIYDLLQELKADGWKGGFGLGTAQWTWDRTITLVELYMEVSGGSEKITTEQATEAEALMMIRELRSSAYEDIYLDWKDSEDIDSTDAAYNAAYSLCLEYEVASGGKTAANERGETAKTIYEAMMNDE